jgi:hypothetical protein
MVEIDGEAKPSIGVISVGCGQGWMRLAPGTTGQVLTAQPGSFVTSAVTGQSYDVGLTWSSASGNVSSVTFTGDGTILSSTPSTAVTSSGTVAATLKTQTANAILAGPATGADHAPTFRAMVAGDLPAGTGTVTSVTFTGDGTVLSSTPTTAVTAGGTLAPALNTQAANAVLIGPASGVAVAPTFRALAAADLGPAAILAGTAGGQTLTGGTAASDNLTLLTTSNATKGKILLGTGAAYDSVNTRFGIGTQSPSYTAHVQTTAAANKGLVVEGYASQSANLQEWQLSTGAAVATVGPTGVLTQTSAAATESAALATDLLAGGTGWTANGWGGSYPTFSAPGNTNALSNSLAAVVSTTYQITYTVTLRTAGTFTLAFGGYTSGNLSASGNVGPMATTTGNLVITPTANFNGSIAVTIQVVSQYNPTYAITASGGGNSFEVRSAVAASHNTYVGQLAGCYTTTGTSNTALGYEALYNSTSGNSHTAVGYECMQSSTTSVQSTAYGYQALQLCTTGSQHAAFGYGTLGKIVTSSSCTAFGYGALNNTTGGGQTAVGYLAGTVVTTGTNNTFLGTITGQNASQLATAVNTICIGYGVYSTVNNQIVIGNSTNASLMIAQGNTSPLSQIQFGPNSMCWASASPTTGTWAQGDICWNTGAAAGGSPGWVCTTGGTSGTWKAMANVAG